MTELYRIADAQGNYYSPLLSECAEEGGILYFYDKQEAMLFKEDMEDTLHRCLYLIKFEIREVKNTEERN